ncbi:Gfo/Idh/MocA family oxidoreductase [Ruficoccus sp. ZRK36]|uniref:Gfo/Idh/MocA family protein n=1 Tax=Ruficoccus sp. ZRK36 TaxID=2866311 RepID=UPI001C73B97F|nr:Gfo/Idh/MocA family oxidoreductase [Ruficoccus sp. ZRK36]QYY37270.1 Gfo/Idh/MocA family oxidoreductase [Ruficoccus sp. ZRK36]
MSSHCLPSGTAQHSPVGLDELEKRLPLTGQMCGPLRVGIVGLGWVARTSHLLALDLLQKRGWPVSVAALCDIDPERLSEAHGKFASAHVYRDARQMMDEQALDAVYILTHPPATVPLVQYALERSLAVFVEKPVSSRPEEIEEVDALANRLGRPVQVGFNRRFQPLADRFRAQLAGIPDVYSVRARLWRRSRKEAIFYEDTFVHMLDFMHQCLGDLQLDRACRLPVRDERSQLSSALQARFRAGKNTVVELDGRPRSGFSLEAYEAFGQDQAVRLEYPGTADTQLSLSTCQAGQREALRLDIAVDDAAGMAYARGFVQQAAAFCRLAGGGDTQPLCGLSDAIWTARMMSRVFDLASRHDAESNPILGAIES